MSAERCSDSAGPSVTLGELRSEYYQLQEAELLLQRHRQKWMQSVEGWLERQAQALHMEMEEPAQPRARGQRKRPFLPEATALPGAAPPGVSSQLGPQRPCPQPRPPDGDPEPQADSPRTSEVPDDGLFKAGVQNAVPQADGRRNALSSAYSQSPEAVAEAQRISEMAERLTLPAARRFKSRNRSRRQSTYEQSVLKWFIEHPAFDSTCAAMILFNSAIIGFGVEYMTTHDEEPFFLVIAGHVCSAFFFVELVLRMKLLGRGFFRGENKWWNMFDFWLVTFSFIDIIITEALSLDASRVGSGMKTIKMLRIVRVFRVFRFFRELSLLALMIIDSMKSLAWALILLTIIIYVFAICFTSRATEHEKLNGAPGAAGPQQSEVHRQFGSLGRTVYSLVQAMLGGVSWGVCADALLSIDAFSGFLFFFYVAFTILAVMNIITGVFVDNAVETARTQRDFLIQKEMELKEKYCNEMRALFAEMDSDGSGSVSFLEVQQYLEDPRVQGYFTALGLDPNDTERLFKLIDTDNTGDVDIGEFLDGCIRLKGQARSIDVYSIMRDLKNLEMKLDSLREGPSPVTGSWFMGDCLVPGALPSSAPTGRT
mmetsp:Transcript_108700/g.350927  ORF Transcript_108700/g.350927 Transcript_108700/m.350927 type:complete len:598 (+) Transcript_108700:68-1861(+)